MSVIAQEEIGAREVIGKGGMALVYAAPDLFLPEQPSGRWVYKRYKDKVRPVSLYGLQSLVKLFHDLPPKQQDVLLKHLNWPVRVVTDDESGASGLILPLLKDEFFVKLRLSSGAVKTKPAEAQYLLMDANYCTRVGLPPIDVGHRRAICRSLAYAMALLDKIDVVYGDLSARNFLYRLQPRPGVLLVDCDAVRRHGDAAAVGAQPHSPDWEPPEAIRARARRDGAAYTIQNKATDRYKLGLAIMRILTPGPGSSTNSDPSIARRALPRPLYQMLVRSLGDDPTARPAAAEWYTEMTR